MTTDNKLFVAAKEFIDDWRKGDFSLPRLAEIDAEAIEAALASRESEAVACKFERNETREGGWTIHPSFLFNLEEIVSDTEFPSDPEQIEQVLLAVEKLYPAQSDEVYKTIKERNDAVIAASKSDEVTRLREELKACEAALAESRANDRFAMSEVARLREDAERTCEWRGWGFDYGGTYDTQCGEAWTFEDGYLKDNGVNFCPYCGGLVKEIEGGRMMTKELKPVAWMVHSGEIWNTPTSPYSDDRGEPLYQLSQLQPLIDAHVQAALVKAAEVCIKEGPISPMIAAKEIRAIHGTDALREYVRKGVLQGYAYGISDDLDFDSDAIVSRVLDGRM